MAYRLFIRRPAEKEIAGLPSPVRERIIKAIRALTDEPRPPGCKKLSGEHHAWRIRIGDYRAGITIEGQNAAFERFLHCKDIYRYYP